MVLDGQLEPPAGEGVVLAEHVADDVVDLSVGPYPDGDRDVAAGQLEARAVGDAHDG